MTLFFGDTSSNNGAVDLKAASADLAGCMIKVTQGVNYVNPDWAGQSQEAEDLSANGTFVPGAFHFADGSAGIEQARWFARHAGHLWGWMIVIDVERNSGGGGSATIADARAIVAELRKLYPFHRIGGYAPHWYTGDAGLRFFDFIIASSYVEGEGSPAELYAKVPASWWSGYGGEEPALLQFTSSAQMPGFSGPADCSAYRGTLAQLAELAGGQGACRRKAKGAWSLAQTAYIRNTTAEFLAGVSRENLTGRELEEFEHYYQEGEGAKKIMPEGLTYYTAHRGGRAG